MQERKKKKKRQKEGGCFRAMDTIKVAWMSKAKAKKLSVSIPRGSLHVSTLQGEGKGRLLSHSMLRIKSLLIFQEAHSPILPFAHLLCFSILPPPPLFLSSLTPLFFFFLYLMDEFRRSKPRKTGRILALHDSLFFFAILLSSKNIYHG